MAQEKKGMEKRLQIRKGGGKLIREKRKMIKARERRKKKKQGGTGKRRREIVKGREKMRNWIQNGLGKKTEIRKGDGKLKREKRKKTKRR